jgi:hypothetical protein
VRWERRGGVREGAGIELGTRLNRHAAALPPTQCSPLPLAPPLPPALPPPESPIAPATRALHLIHSPTPIHTHQITHPHSPPPFPASRPSS